MQVTPERSARRAILTILLNIFKEELGATSEVAYAQDFHYDIAEAYYYGKIERDEYVRFLSMAEAFYQLDNLHILSLIGQLDAIKPKRPEPNLWAVCIKGGTHIFNDPTEAELYAKAAGPGAKIERWHSSK